ncbi:MAG TPA: hypothetical protein QF469_01755 [Sphingomonas sanguinis]|uniref:hypothetical protein n=1 Tax=Sphingomonas sanguinis TaxID=33051 RepID=UPI002AC02554|nr:hypothetical protein [Sphingomonas sanguinis]
MMRRAFACLLLAALTAATPPPPERVIAPDGKATLSVNGIARTVLIDPAALGIPIITKDYAQAAGMKPGMIEVSFTVGPVKLEGKTAVAEIQAGTGAAYKRRIAFAERPFANGFDGVFGPASLPDPVIRFRLRDPQAGERVISLPMVGGGGMFGDWGSRYVVIPIEGEPMRVIFNPRKAYSSTNAGGAVRLARAYQGQLTGATTLGEVAFGVERPLRTLALQTPVAVGPFAMTQLSVRTADAGSTATIADADAPGDPDEVVVTGKGKHDPKKDWLSIGADQLGRCSSIVFDKPAKQVRLSCL